MHVQKILKSDSDIEVTAKMSGMVFWDSVSACVVYVSASYPNQNSDSLYSIYDKVRTVKTV